MPEAWLLAIALAGAAPDTMPDAPSADLLEFLGEWTEEEARLIDDYRAATAKTGNRVGKDVKHESGDQRPDTRSGSND